MWRYRAQRFWKRWYFWATHSRLKPVLYAATTLKVHLHNIFTFFSHRITNATTESVNARATPREMLEDHDLLTAPKRS